MHMHYFSKRLFFPSIIYSSGKMTVLLRGNRSAARIVAQWSPSKSGMLYIPSNLRCYYSTTGTSLLSKCRTHTAATSTDVNIQTNSSQMLSLEGFCTTQEVVDKAKFPYPFTNRSLLTLKQISEPLDSISYGPSNEDEHAFAKHIMDPCTLSYRIHEPTHTTYREMPMDAFDSLSAKAVVDASDIFAVILNSAYMETLQRHFIRNPLATAAVPMLCNKTGNDHRNLWIGTPHKGKWKHKHFLNRKAYTKRYAYALQGVDILKMKNLKWGEVRRCM